MHPASTRTTAGRRPIDVTPVLPGPFVVDDAFEDTAVLDALHHWFLSTPNTGHLGGFFAPDLSVEHRRVLDWTGGDEDCGEPRLLDWARTLVARVRDTEGARRIQACDGRAIRGYEFWGNVSSVRGKTGYHIDRDENVDWVRCMVERIFPVVSTVTYVGPRAVLRGGDLLVDMGDDAVSFHVRAMRSGMSEAAVIAARDTWVRIPYRHNRVVVFPGDRPHLVTPLEDAQVLRCAVGVGLWHRVIA
ncbi:MAG: hypothetical protein H6983_11760 [Ectothiorhodospiraceae bacterium]|nr:hypothetical protein [Chromatiales bacterium]MCP5154836.1 hypothetical protein [Ectothiorhodospiraceae bacterium]